MRIGHVHLKVRNLQQSIAFYQDALGLAVTERLGDALAFLSAGALHHELALQAVGPGAGRPGRADTGLYHVAFEVPDRPALAAVYQALRHAGVAVHPVDHRISWALYFNDPDVNGVEVYWDTRATAQGVTRWDGIDRPLTEQQLGASE